MDAELMKSRIEKAVERYERKQMKARKSKAWSKINRGSKHPPINNVNADLPFRNRMVPHLQN